MEGVKINFFHSKNKELEAELKQKEAELKARAEELEKIIFAASHDLRIPLLNIQGFNQELKNSIAEVKELTAALDCPPEQKQELKEALEENVREATVYIQDNSNKLDRLLTGVIKFARLIRDGFDYEQVDVNQLIKPIVNSYHLGDKNITVEVKSLPDCWADKRYLREVFVNLIDNAVKYLPAEEDGKITISGCKEEDRVVYWVADNGLGIKEEYQQQIFKVFYSLDQTKSTSEGMGLAMVEKIIKLHNGQVGVESEPGEGSKFFVSLPRKE